MSIPDDLVQMLGALDADKSDVDAKTGVVAQRDAAVTEAETKLDASKVDRENAGHDLDASQAHLGADLEATIAKLKATYGG